jgi:hypothetical protein
LNNIGIGQATATGGGNAVGIGIGTLVINIGTIIVSSTGDIIPLGASIPVKDGSEVGKMNSSIPTSGEVLLPV